MTKRRTHDFKPRLMRARQAAYYLGMSETKLRNLVDAGKIAKPLREGQMTFWDVNDLDDYVDQLHEAQPAPSDDWDGLAA